MNTTLKISYFYKIRMIFYNIQGKKKKRKKE
jgi:hypothetical protein